MGLPFTRLEFLQVFAEYNESIWPLQVFAAALGLAALALLFANKPWADRGIAGRAWLAVWFRQRKAPDVPMAE